MTLPIPLTPRSSDFRAVRGSVTPRLWTPPLRPLTPATSYGFAVVDFARSVLGRPLDPWQEWDVIHAGEMLPDGRPRFRNILVLVARQNGKTWLLVVLSLFWIFIERWPLVLGTSTKLDYSRESWDKAVAIARSVRQLARRIPAKGGVRSTNGEQHLKTTFDTRYKIGAANDDGGRSLSIDRLVQDELRQHHDYSAWNAGTGAMSARPLAQNWCLSNAGDDKSVVLNDKRDEALTFIRWWEENGDEAVAELILAGELPAGMPSFRNGLFEWSAPLDADPLDLDALAQANPNLGVVGWDGLLRMDPQEVYLEGLTALTTGGLALTGFKTEKMCIRVVSMDPAIDPNAWRACIGPADLAGRRMAWCLDVSPDLEHATLTAAAMDGETAVLDVVEAWEGPTAVRQLQDALPGLVERNKPAVLGWFPKGPAAAAAAGIRDRHAKDRFYAWPPLWLEVQEITAETSAVCMGFAVDVKARLVRHADDPLQTGHVTAADRLATPGDTWRFSRRGAGHVDAAYAAAGAAHLARTLPKAPGTVRIVTGDD